MLTRLTLVLILVVAGDAIAQCTRAATVRVRFHNCQVAPRMVQIDGDDVELDFVDEERDPNYFEGRLTGPLTDDYPIQAVGGDPPICCMTDPELKRKEKGKGCYLYYVVACDARNPGWGLKASSRTAGVTFAFSSDHPDHYGKPACAPEVVSINPPVIEELGENDRVRLRLFVRGEELLTGVLVKLNNFNENGEYPLDAKRLEKEFDRMMREEYRSEGGPADFAAKDRKTRLPKGGILLRKQ